MKEATASQADVVRTLFAAIERAHQAEDVGTHVGFFDADTVWVTGRGVCYRGQDHLAEYLRGAIPGGLGAGSVRYAVESVHPVGRDLVVVVVDQTYTDAKGQPRDERARHTHTYVVSMAAEPRILAGQNTVQVAD